MSAPASLDADLRALVREIADFPEPGVLFRDITPLLADADGFARVVDALAETGRDAAGDVVVDKVVGVEARGFILAAPVALALGAGFVPVRKAGKLPGETHRVSYALEYGEAALEVHVDAFGPADRVLVIDDVLATGGTLGATAALIEACGAEVADLVVLIELAALGGRASVRGRSLTALTTL